MKPGFHLWMLKPKSSKGSGYAYIRQTNFKQTLPACQKADENCFLGEERVLMVEFMQQGTIIILELYCETLTKLYRAIQNKRHGMLTSGVALINYNASPHTRTAASIRTLLEHFN
jgi:hypothetical protein